MSPTLPVVWNFHARPKECVRYMFSFSIFRWFRKHWRVLYLYIVWRLDWKPLHLKILSGLLARTHKHWYLTSLLAAVEYWKCSPANCFSCGSTRTCLQTSFTSIDVMLNTHQMHIKYNENKIAKKLGMLYKAKNYLSKRSLVTAAGFGPTTT